MTFKLYTMEELYREHHVLVEEKAYEGLNKVAGCGWCISRDGQRIDWGFEPNGKLDEVFEHTKQAVDILCGEVDF